MYGNPSSTKSDSLVQVYSFINYLLIFTQRNQLLFLSQMQNLKIFFNEITFSTWKRKKCSLLRYTMQDGVSPYITTPYERIPTIGENTFGENMSYVTVSHMNALQDHITFYPCEF